MWPQCTFSALAERLPRTPPVLFALAFLFLAGAKTGDAQAVPAAIRQPANSRLELYGGYGYFNPSGAYSENYLIQPMGSMAVGSLAGYFTRFLGVEAEGAVSAPGAKPCVYDAEAGPRLRFAVRSFVPYVHALAGGSKLGGPVGQRCTWGWGLTVGGGLDYVLPFGHDHLAARLVQVDYARSHVMFPHPESVLVTGGGVRLSTGLVIRAGAVSARAPESMSCPAEPANVFAGEPVSVTAVLQQDLGRRRAAFSWTASRGHITGSGETVAIDTAGLAAGDYEIAGRVTTEGVHRVIASCRSSFRVHAPDPVKDALTLRCAAEPGSLSPGGSTVITSEVVDPLHRPLAFSYSSTAGSVDGKGTSANLTVSRIVAGTVEVACGVADDLGRTAAFTLSLPITQPPPPAAPATPAATPHVAAAAVAAAPISAACEISFTDDRGHAARLNQEARACLDALAVRLEAEPGTRVVLLGHSLSSETAKLAAQRTVRSALYLVQVKRIDPARVDMRTGGEPGQAVSSFLLKPGQVMPPNDTSSIDTNSLTRALKATHR